MRDQVEQVLFGSKMRLIVTGLKIAVQNVCSVPPLGG